MNDICAHLQDVTDDPMPPGGCEECLAIGGHWLHLRFCVACRRTLCCDDSPNRHASKHARDADHPVIRSKEPGEHWAYCFVDDIGVEL